MTVSWATVLAAIEAREAAARADARPSPALSQSIGRRRAARFAALAGAVGCLFGVAGWEAARPAPAASAEVAPVTWSEPVALNIVNDRSLSAFEALPECGGQAPAVRTSYGGIGIGPTLWNGTDNRALAVTFGGTLALSVTADATAPLGTPVVATMGVIYAQGGVVVGYSTADASPVFGALGVDALNPSVGVHARSPFCTGGSVDLADGLPVGDYQAFPVVRIHASPEVAAWRSVIWGPHAAATRTTTDVGPSQAPPGCQVIAGAISAPNVPPECSRAAGLDLTGPTALVRYPVDYYTGDLDLPLVGNPVTFSVEQASVSR